MCEGQVVEATDLSIGETQSGADQATRTSPHGSDGTQQDIEVLKETGGNKLETAKRLGIGRQTLYNKIRPTPSPPEIERTGRRVGVSANHSHRPR